MGSLFKQESHRDRKNNAGCRSQSLIKARCTMCLCRGSVFRASEFLRMRGRSTFTTHHASIPLSSASLPPPASSASHLKCSPPTLVPTYKINTFPFQILVADARIALGRCPKLEARVTRCHSPTAVVWTSPELEGFRFPSYV
jgi:hypothetical protein